MPPNAATELKNVSLIGQKKTAVVVGGATGTGGGIARRLAQLGCNRIIICSRNETRGKDALEVLKKIAPRDSGLVVQFVQGDLSDVKGMRAAAASLQEAAPAGIDYLVMTQNGAPAGSIKHNSDGHDTAFAVQAISRFALAYLLTTRGGLAPNAIVMSIYYNWGHTLDDLDVNDLSLMRRLGTQNTTNMYKSQTRRDCTVLDSFTEEFNIRYPQYRYFCLWPGLVAGEGLSAKAFPSYLKVVVWVGLKTVAITPDEYANVPVYILASPDAQKTLGPGKYFDHNLNPGMIGKWATDAQNRQVLWEKLTEIIGEK
ncbi:hypothetical protein B0H19DRAFT_1375037 [Mycena capillaripes]|nr:hypothetical protein B0H19DRAFT_1375037 [Mycena capillaripes]